MPSAHEMEVTPEMAEEWLKGNINNRKLRESHVADLARAMQVGAWVPNHDAVQIATDGELLNGQHRLRAVIQSGVTVVMKVEIGADKASFATCDLGLKRSLSDVTGLDRRVVEVAAFLARIAWHVKAPSHIDIERIMGSPIGPLISDLISYCGAQQKVFSGVSVKVACVMSSYLTPKTRDYAFSQYRALVIKDYASMSPASLAFTRHVEMNKINAIEHRYQIIRTGMTLFDHRRANLSRLPIHTHDVGETITAIRNAVRDATGTGEAA